MWKSPEQTLDPTQMSERKKISYSWITRGVNQAAKVQKSTFIATIDWINFHLKPTGMQIDDLFQDIKKERMVVSASKKTCKNYPKKKLERYI